MRRKTFDALLTSAGSVLVLVLVVAGALGLWAQRFINDQVASQLSQQQIFFPAAGSPALADPAIGPYLDRYAGQQLTTGAQAEAWADHYIAVHLKKIGGGLTYAQLSAKATADPSNAKLAGQVDTVFRGETLRGLLLNAYAFGKMATIAGYAAVAAFAGAAVMLVLTGLGVVHLRRVDAHVEVFPGLLSASKAPAVSGAAAAS